MSWKDKLQQFPRLMEIATAVAIGLASLIWIARGGLSYIYGEDSVSFAHPWNFNSSPIIPYSYLYSRTFPVPDTAPHFYFDSVTYALNQILPSVGFDERIVLVLLALLCSGGFWLLTRTLAKEWYGSATSAFVPRVVATLLYVVNPYSVTVIWWHIEGWTLFYAFLPFEFWLVLSIYIEGKVRLRAYVSVVLLGMFLAPGVTAGFAVPVTLVPIWFAAAVVIREIRLRSNWKSTLMPLVALIALPLLLYAWDLGPYLLLPNPAYTSSGYVTSGNLVFQFQNASTYTTLWNNVRLVGMGWSYSVPNAYPWGTNTLALIVAGTLVFASYVAGGFWIGKRRALVVIYLLSILAVLGSVGSNGPTGPINRLLLNIGGPFLVGVDSYFFLGEIYVVVACISVLVVLKELPWIIRRILSTLDRRVPNTPFISRAWPSVSLSTSTKSSVALTAQVAVAGMIAVAAFAPVVVYGEYVTRGANIDQFTLPASFDDLSAFFSRDYVAPNLNVLVLPMSNLDALPMAIDGQSFIDSSNLISNYIPYPVLGDNVGALPAGLMNWFGQSQLGDSLEVLQALHIGYVVVNPYANFSSPFVTTSPSGSVVNWTYVFSALNDSLGIPQRAGDFGVYSVPGVTPIVWATGSLQSVEVGSLAEFIDFVSSVANDTLLGDWLDRAVWADGGEMPNAVTITPSPVSFPVQSWALPDGDSGFAILGNGSTIPIPSTEASQRGLSISGGSGGNVIESSFPQTASLNRSEDFSTTMVEKNGAYYNPAGNSTQLVFSRPSSSELVLNATINLTPVSGQNWFTVSLENGSLDLAVQFYYNTSSPGLSLGLTALNNATPYAWTNEEIPSFQPNNQIALLVWLNSSVLSARVTVSSAGAGPPLDLIYVGRSAVTLNPGHNVSAYPDSAAFSKPVQIVAATVRANLSLKSLAIFNQSGVAYIVTATSPLVNSTAISTGVFGSGGDWTLTVPSNLTRTFDVVLALPQFPSWTATTESGTVSRLSATPENVVFQITPANSSGATEVRVHFDTLIGWGIVVSELEVAAGLFLLIFPGIVVVGRRLRLRGDSTKTPRNSGDFQRR